MKQLMLLLTLLISTACLSAPSEIVMRTHNTVFIRTAITEATVDQAINELYLAVETRKRMVKSKQSSSLYPIFLVLESPGGSVFAGERFIKYAKHIKNLHTLTLYSASMAHTIVQSLPGYRYVDETGVFMAHRAKATFSGQIYDGELEQKLKFVKAIIGSIETRVSKRIGISLSKYRSKIKDEWWSYGAGAVKEGVADAMVVAKCSEALIKKTIKIVRNSMFGPFESETSACPFINGVVPKSTPTKQLTNLYPFARK